MTFSKLLRGRVFQKGAISLLIALFVLEPVLYAQAQEADTSVLPAPSAEVSTPEPAQTESVQPLQPGASGESAPEIDASVSDPEASLTEPSLEPEADAAKTDPAGIEGGMSALSGGGTNYYPGFKTDTSYKTPFTQPKVDESSGALIYEVPVFVPAGRNGIQPDIRLRYSSNDRSINENILGLGWGLSIPFIERFATSGTQQLYTQYGFRSSISGELVRTATSSYAARTERGDFLNYGFDGTVWTATAKNGWIYTFGSTSTARQFDSASSTRIFKWMLTEIRDLDGNYATYTYDKDEEQVYPDEISYTHATGTSGIYTVVFDRESRPRDGLSYRAGFLVKTRYRISVIRVLVSGNERYRMTLGYGTGDNTTNSLLTSATERGTDALGATLTRPALAFNYDRRVTSLQSLPPQPPLGYSNDGFQMGEVNGDGLPDFVMANWNDVYSTSTRKVYMNRQGVIYEQNTGWTIPLGFEFVNYSSGADLGVRFVDMNGDGLSDFLSRSKGIWYNNGTSTWTFSGVGIPVSFNQNYDPYGLQASGAYLLDLNKDGLTDILTKDYAYLFTGTGFTTTTQWSLPMYLSSYAQERNLRETQFTDLNGDGLSDLIWMSGTRAMHDDTSGSSFTVTTATHRFFINTGSSWLEDASSSTFQGFAANAQFYKDKIPNYFYVRVNSSRFMDVNGDGLQDYLMYLDDSTINVTCGRQRSANSIQSRAYLNTGNGFVTSTNIPLELNKFTEVSQPSGCTLKYGYYVDRGVHVVDTSGDTITNVTTLLDSYQPRYNLTYWSTDTLSAITFPEGGNATITYAGSAQQYLGSPTNPTLLNPSLPMVQKVVDSIATNDLNGNSTSTKYIYEGGYLYRDASRPVDTAFAGFARVREISTGKIRVSYFHQGDAVDTANGENADSYSRIGLPYKTVTTNPAGNVFSVSMTRYDEQDLPESSGEPNRKFVFPAQKTVQTYDGGSLHRDTAETLAYDAAGNVIDHLEYGEVTATGTGAFTDITGDERRTQTAFATFSSGASSSFPYLITESGFGAATSVKDLLYDGQSTGTVQYGHVTREVNRDATGALSVAVNNAYDSLGLMTSSTNAVGSTVQMSYDPYKLFVTTTTNALGHVVSAVYDAALGEPTTITDENGKIRRVVYDPLGRPKQMYGPDRTGTEVLLWEIVYTDTSGAVKTTKTTYFDASNQSVVITYFDGFGRDIQRRRSAHSTYYSVTYKIYDKLGHLSWESVPLWSDGSAKTTAPTNNSYYVITYFDPLDRVSAVQTGLGTAQHAHDRWTETITDWASRVKTVNRDAYGRIISVIERNGGSNYTTQYTYDRSGHLLSITDASGNVRAFTYDVLGRRLSAQDLHASGDGTFLSIDYGYDANNNLLSETRSDGSSITYTYDAIDRPLTTNENGTTTHTIAYDSCTVGVGRPCSDSGAGYSKAFEYDPNGNVKKSSLTFGSNTYDETFLHDRQGRVTSSTAPDGMSLGYTYTNARLTGFTTTEAGSSTRSIITSVIYGPDLKPIEINYGNGVKSVLSYDSYNQHRIVNANTSKGATVLQNIWYSYDNLGRVKTIDEQAPTAARHKVNYWYDDLDRLTLASASSGVGALLYKESFTYDPLGNILTANLTDASGTSTTSTYAYVGTGNTNPHAVTSVTSTTNGALAGSQTFAYDTRGNLIELKMYDASGTEIIAQRRVNSFSPSNQATGTNIGNGAQLITYSYDQSGLRLSQGDASSTTIYVSPAYNLTRDNASSTIIDVQKHINAAGISALVDGTGNSARLLFSHPDHLGGSNVITDSAGAIEELLDYHAFGSVRLDQKAGTWSDQRKFSGHEADKNTGYLYMKARYYDPSLKRFLSQDPAFWELKVSLEDPQGWNSYAYARNSPLVLVDPDGRAYWPSLSSGFISEGTGIVNWLAQPTPVVVGQFAKGVVYDQPKAFIQDVYLSDTFRNKVAGGISAYQKMTPEQRDDAKGEIQGRLGAQMLFSAAISAGTGLSIKAINRVGPLANVYGSRYGNYIPRVSRGSLPANVRASLRAYEKNGWQPREGMQSKPYYNKEGYLPDGQRYTEFDVNLKTGPTRDAQRFFVGSKDGSVFYTDTHMDPSRGTIVKKIN